MLQLPHRSQSLPRLRLVLTIVLLAACSSAPQPPPPPDTHEVDSWVMRGYLSDTRHAFEVASDEVMLEGAPVKLAWTLPSKGRRLPWVIYLPGLGEASESGRAWREAWARAGYAVLSIASADDDHPPPGLAHQTDPPEAATGTPQEQRQRLLDQRDALHEWARQRYLPAAARQRTQRLRALLTTLLAREPAGPLARVDRSAVALAGYDIGAYTALLSVGEMPGAAWVTVPAPVPVKAVIALSPYADFGGTAFAQRYRDIQVPVLSVSGSGDEDQAGTVPSAFVRRAPFENLPGHAALLWLKSTSHQVLSGGSADAAMGGRPERSGGPEESRQGMARRSTDQAVDRAVIAATTTAFLDAEFKADPVARSWLAVDAARWIRPRGEWLQR